MASSKNKCPKCGGEVRVTADVSCAMRIQPTGKRELITPKALLVREIATVAGYGYPYKVDCVCEKCGEKLNARVEQSGAFVFSTDNDFF